MRVKVLETEGRWGDSFPMTVVADSKKRVVLPVAEPGDRFEVRVAADGTVVLARLHPVPSRPARVKVEKRGGFSVGILNHPIDDEALREALAELP